jgi:hypothetical protein
MDSHNKKDSPYKITVKVRQQELAPPVIEQKVSDFQRVFVNIASRYYNEQKKGERP